MMLVPDKERLLLWVEALESGEYEQGRFANQAVVYDEAGGYRGLKYCCLGVANAVAYVSGCEESRLHSNSTLDASVAEWFGIGAVPVIAVDDNDITINAMDANDSLEWDFLKIAAAIRVRFELGERKVSIG